MESNTANKISLFIPYFVLWRKVTRNERKSQSLLIRIYSEEKSCLYAVCLDVAVHHGIDGQGGYGAHVEFFHDVLAVGDDGGGADAQSVGDFLVGQPADDEDKHFYLSGGKPVGVALRNTSAVCPARILRQVAAMGVCALLQLQQGAGQGLLVQADVQRVEVGSLRRTGGPVGQDDGLGLAFHEERAVFQQGL